MRNPRRERWDVEEVNPLMAELMLHPGISTIEESGDGKNGDPLEARGTAVLGAIVKQRCADTSDSVSDHVVESVLEELRHINDIQHVERIRKELIKAFGDRGLRGNRGRCAGRECLRHEDIDEVIRMLHIDRVSGYSEFRDSGIGHFRKNVI